MRVQKIRLNDHQFSWLVLNDEGLPIKPIAAFFHYLNNIDKSPLTVRAYAYHLKLYWEYLQVHALDWQSITLDNLAGFVGWLREPVCSSNVISINEDLARRTSTINSILGSLTSFYRYHHHSGNTNVELTETVNFQGSCRKGLLYHIHRHCPRQKRLISLKNYKRMPKIITEENFKELIKACTNARDRFLMLLLFETGLRIGQALTLRHEDIVSWDNEIHIRYRTVNLNEARNKSTQPNILHVSTQLMRLYSDYINALEQDKLTEYVFVNLQDYTPLRYTAVRSLFSRLSDKVNIKVTPHMLRHTHATELIHDGWDSALVQKRLGHASVQTTLDVYSHVDQRAMKEAFKAYQEKREEK